MRIKLGGAADRFCDYLCVDYVNLPRISKHNHFKNTKLTKKNTKMLKSSENE